MFSTTAVSLAAEPELTFFGWSDQHVTTEGDASHLIPAIDAMNELPGKEYPSDLGGSVAEPAFVFGCGDITEWPTHAAKEAYDTLLSDRLKFPARDILGNHDEGGKAPSQTMKNWLLARHGSLSYTFDASGIHFIALFAKYDENLNNPAQPLAKESLEYVRKALERIGQEAPVIIAAHLCYDAMTNRDELIDAIGDANVIAILGGHYHKAKIDQYRGRVFLQLPSPAPGSPSEFTVVRIHSDRMVAIPYDYAQGKWCDDPRKILNVAIRGPSPIRSPRD
jgi:hypothetical protein